MAKATSQGAPPTPTRPTMDTMTDPIVAVATIGTPTITTLWNITHTGPRAKPCPHCGATPGQECTTRNNGRLGAFHAARITGNPTPTPHRPTLLTPELQQTICHKLANGSTLTTAAQAAGIGETTLHNWLTKGQSNPEENPDAEPYREFREALLQARAEGAARMAENIVEAGFRREKSRKPLVSPSGQPILDPNTGEVLAEVTYDWDWKAHGFMLERGFASEFGKRTMVEVSHADAAAQVLAAGVGELESDAVADRIWGHVQAARRRQELESGDVVEGEVVEPESSPEGV